MAEERWRRVAEIARWQYAIVSIAQLLACGLSRRAVSWAVTTGRLYPLHRGVYAVGQVPVDPRAGWMAATLAAGETSSLSHRPGAELLGMLPAGGGIPHVTVPGANGRRLSTVRIHHSNGIHPDEVGHFARIPCTSPGRVVLDVAATGTRWELERCVREGTGLGLLATPDLGALLERHPGRRGTARIRALITGSERPIPERTLSELERRIYRLCLREGIECPRMNLRIETDVESFLIDCVWPEERLAIECDSRWHDNPITSRRDVLKDQALTLAGWRVHRLRWLQIVNAPGRAARTIRILLEQQRRLLNAAA